MKKLFYLASYSIIMLIGHFINVFGLPSVFSASLPIILVYALVALFIGVIVPIGKKEDTCYYKLIIPLVFISVILISTLMHFNNHETYIIIIANIINSLVILGFEFKYR